MTDTITLPRSVAEQALLALRIDDLSLVRESVIALREALEQPQGQTMTDTITLPRSVAEQALLALRIDDLSLVRESVIALREALEQPQVEQAPVAWAVMQGGAICWEADYPFSNEPGWCDSDQQSVPLYTNPQPPRQPLTEMEIVDLRQLTPGTLDVQFVKFARAIEAAHGIKEQK